MSFSEFGIFFRHSFSRISSYWLPIFGLQTEENPKSKIFLFMGKMNFIGLNQLFDFTHPFRFLAYFDLDRRGRIRGSEQTKN